MHSVQPIETRQKVSDFDLESFRCLLFGMLEEHRREHCPMLREKSLRVITGRRYARIFHGSSIYCFVEMATGNICKPATVKKVAPHPRGNIFNAEPLKCCGPYGVAYIK